MIRTTLLALSAPLMLSLPLWADCPNNTITDVVFGNGILTTHDEAQNALNILSQAVLKTLGSTIDHSCVQFELAYDSLFFDSNNQVVVDLTNFFPQLADAMAQRGVDFGANFWTYWNSPLTAPSWFAQLQQQLILSATSIVQPDLIKQEAAYTSELLRGHNIVILAHSQGNLYANQAFSVVGGLVGTSGLSVVAVATPASQVAGSGRYFTLFGDVITSVPASLPPNTFNNQLSGSSCPTSLDLTDLSAANACHDFVFSYMAEVSGVQTRPAILAAIIQQVLPPNALTVTDRNTFITRTSPNVIVGFDDVAAPLSAPFTDNDVAISGIQNDGSFPSVTLNLAPQVQSTPFFSLPYTFWFSEEATLPNLVVANGGFKASFPADIWSVGFDYVCFSCSAVPDLNIVEWQLLSDTGAIVACGVTVADFSPGEKFFGIISSNLPFRSLVLNGNLAPSLVGGGNWLFDTLRYGL